MRWSGSLRGQIAREFREVQRLRYGAIHSDEPTRVELLAAFVLPIVESARRIVTPRRSS